MEAIFANEYFYQERFKIANEYIQKIVELKKLNTPDAHSKILSFKRIIRAMYNVQ